MKKILILIISLILSSCTNNIVFVEKTINSKGDANMSGSSLEDTLKGNRQENNPIIEPPISL
jgi:uncharacterized protein YxeA